MTSLNHSAYRLGLAGALGAVALFAAGCGGRGNAAGGTGESIGGGGNYAKVIERHVKEVEFGLRLAEHPSFSPLLCQNVEGMTPAQKTDVAALLRTQAGRVRAVLGRLKFKVVPYSLSIEDAEHKLYPVRAKLLKNDEVLLQQKAVDAGNGGELIVHEAFHVAGTFLDFLISLAYPYFDGGQRRLDDAGRCLVKLVKDNYPSAAATDPFFAANGLLSLDDRLGWMASDRLGNVVLLTYTSLPSPDPAYPQLQYRVQRRLPDGRADDSFGDAGTAVVPRLPTDGHFGGYLRSLAVAGDGSVVAVGYTVGRSSLTQDWIFRFRADGTADTTFNTNANAALADTTAYKGISVGVPVAFQEDKVLVGSMHYVPGTGHILLYLGRLLSTGFLDPTFGAPLAGSSSRAGWSTLTIGTAFQPTTVTPLEDGSIFTLGIIANDVTAARPWRLGAARFTAEGEGTPFGPFTFPGATHQYTSATTLQGGKILTGGYRVDASGSAFALMRFLADGRPDTSFNETGQRVLDFFSGTSAEISGLVTQSDGKVVGAGWTQDAGGYRIGLFRLRENGSIDETFRRGDQQGQIRMTPGSSPTVGFLGRGSRGELLVAGEHLESGERKLFVTRLFGETAL